MTIVLTILLITVCLFVSNRFPLEIVALLSLVALAITGHISSQEALSGFSNSTVIMIGGLFIVGGAIFQLGIAEWVAIRIVSLTGNSPRLLLLSIVLLTAVLSALLSNTGTVAVLLPIVLVTCKKLNRDPRQFLMPFVFAAQLGGLLSLVGSPPNLVVNDAMQSFSGKEFSFFGFAHIGLPLIIVLVIYSQFLSLEETAKDTDDETRFSDKAKDYHLLSNVFSVKVGKESTVLGKDIATLRLASKFGVNVFLIKKDHQDDPRHKIINLIDHLIRRRKESETVYIEDISAQTHLDENDLLFLLGVEEHVDSMCKELALTKLKMNYPSASDESLDHKFGLAEIMIAPRSRFVDKSLRDIRFSSKFKSQVLGINRGHQSQSLPFYDEPLKAGDALLLKTTRKHLHFLKESRNDFILLLSSGSPLVLSKARVSVCLFIVFGLIASFVFKWGSPAINVVFSAVLLILTRCIAIKEAYQAIQFNTLLLIAGMIPMGLALQNSGTTEYLSQLLVSWLQHSPPYYFLGGVFLLTMIMSQFISNTATAIIVAPLFIQASALLNIAPEPICLMVAVGASSAFLTPMASPVNALVITPGKFTFSDFIKKGLPLVVLIFIISMIIVPLIWPL